MRRENGRGERQEEEARGERDGRGEGRGHTICNRVPELLVYKWHKIFEYY